MAVAVTIYARAGCHLCDQARAQILRLAVGGRPIELREIDIESDERLLSAYLKRIPVVEVAGLEVSELEFDADAFSDALHTVEP
jgi:hypothetical protein